MKNEIESMDKIIVLDFGSQYNQLLARKVRELGVYSEVLTHRTTAEQIKNMTNVKGIILSGGSDSTSNDDALELDKAIYELGIPILGIGYGMDLMMLHHGGNLKKATEHGYAKDKVEILNLENPLFKGLKQAETFMMSQGDLIVDIPANFDILATNSKCPVAAAADDEKKLYGIQFHPEALDENPNGIKVLRNFAFDICGCEEAWSMAKFIDIEIEKIRETVGDKKVLLALSGGVDSSVVGVLLQKAIGDQLTCIFVDHGLLRKGEADQVMESLVGKFGLNIILVNEKERFLSKLAGVSDPETKRKIIGNEFINVFDDEATKLNGIEFLAQGTIYSDVIESGTETSKTIKSHHNVGGLPEDMQFKLIEPLNTLFKDEVRKLGTELGMPDSIVWRQPFPGPGLGIRVLGEITEEKLEIVRESDAILREEIANAGLDRSIWQYFTVLPGIRSVGIKNGERSYDYTVGIRAVHSTDGMTSEWARIPYEVLEVISKRIVTEVENVNRIVYDITTKPPSTIEWE